MNRCRKVLRTRVSPPLNDKPGHVLCCLYMCKRGLGALGGKSRYEAGAVLRVTMAPPERPSGGARLQCRASRQKIVARDSPVTADGKPDRSTETERPAGLWGTTPLRASCWRAADALDHVLMLLNQCLQKSNVCRPAPSFTPPH
jgi:hypothetical protein